jgi:hypothetical protein
MDSLPSFVKSHDNVGVVLPPQLAQPAAETKLSPGDTKLTAIPNESEPTLPAQSVLDKLVAAFTKKNPALTVDPIGFFANQLTSSFPQDRSEKPDDDIYRLRDVIRRVELAKKASQKKPVTVEAEIERVRNAVRRSKSSQGSNISSTPCSIKASR